METTPNIFPVLRYDDAPAAIAFLVGAFGFETRADYRTPNGVVTHADLAWAGGGIGVSSAGASAAGSPWARVRQGVYLVVDDPDACYERARSAGAEVAVPIADQDYGSRDFTLRDPEGHLWAFGTYDMARRPGRPAIFPEVHYRDAEAAAAWLERAIGFTRTLTVPASDGSLMHAELRLGPGVVMVGPNSAGQFAGVSHCVNLRVDDPDAHCARARAAGATIVKEPHTTPYGARSYAARDSEGFLWWISNYEPAWGE